MFKVSNWFDAVNVIFFPVSFKTFLYYRLGLLFFKLTFCRFTIKIDVLEDN